MKSNITTGVTVILSGEIWHNASPSTSVGTKIRIPLPTVTLPRLAKGKLSDAIKHHIGSLVASALASPAERLHQWRIEGKRMAKQAKSVSPTKDKAMRKLLHLQARGR